MEDTELRKYFVNIDKRFSALELFIKEQIDGLAIITGKSFALMHERLDTLEEKVDVVEQTMVTKDDLALLESRLQGHNADL